MNVVIASGRLTADPEIGTYGKKGNLYCRFSIAINNGKDENGEEREATFIPCIAFNNAADYLERFGMKGGRVTINGAWKSGSYENQNGDKIYTNECIVRNIEIIDFYNPDDADDEEPPKKQPKREEKSRSTRQTSKKSSKQEHPKRRNSRPNPADADDFVPFV